MQLDADILLWINGHHTEWLDSVMWTISQAKTWVPLYLLLICTLAHAYKGEKTFRSWVPCLVAIACIAAAAGLADFVSSGILKGLVARPRPTHEPMLEGLIRVVNNYRGGHYGFPSSHAADTMAVATGAMLFLHRAARRTDARWQKMVRIAWMIVLPAYVAANCYSRMYLGVHYPTDIATGLLIGATLSAILYHLCKRMGNF